MYKILIIGLILVSCGTQAKKEENQAAPEPVISSESVINEDSLASQRDKEMDDELRIYSGHFEWHPEGGAEGVGSLTLTYNNNREFTFVLSTSLYECGANLEGTLFADRSQHAFYRSDSCFMHFNFLVGNTVEIIEEKCNAHPPECKFEGDYVRVVE